MSSSSYNDKDDKNINAEEEEDFLGEGGTLDLIDGDAELPLPIGMAERISNDVEPPKQIRKVEIKEDNDGPALPPAMLGDDMLLDNPTKMAVSAAGAGMGLQLGNELSQSTPFNVAEFDDGDDAVAKKIAKEEDVNQKLSAVRANEDLIHVPTRQDIEGDDIQDGNINRGDGSGNRRGWGDIESRGDIPSRSPQPIQTQQGRQYCGRELLQ